MNTIEIYDVRPGNIVRWQSAAGEVTGVVDKVEMGFTAANTYVPWYIIKGASTDTAYMTSHRMCGNPSYLRMMKFEILGE
jgi:hypothetical protein